jgi:hypothetical protein
LLYVVVILNAALLFYVVILNAVKDPRISSLRLLLFVLKSVLSLQFLNRF